MRGAYCEAHLGDKATKATHGANKEKQMTVPKWNESEFATSVLSNLGLIDPADRLNKPELVERILPLITTAHVVDERSEAKVSANGFAKSQCPMLFLDVPAKHWRPVEEGGTVEEYEGMQALADAVWAETSVQGSVQRALPGRFILCQHSVRRNMTHPNTGASPVSVQVRFVTEDAAVANVYYTTPVTGSLVRKAESVSKQLDLAVERMPENAENVAALLQPAVLDAVNKLSQITERAGVHLTVTSDGRLAVTSGNGRKAS